jgi:hypothetical protein
MVNGYLLADYGGRGLTEDKGCRKGKETGKGEAREKAVGFHESGRV